jgi:RNA polymerase sigma-70 factor (ECF subfamily)
LDDDQRLAEAARSGDADAWEELYRAAYPRMLAYATRRLGHQDARDAVGEAVARAVAGVDRFQWRGTGFDGWLFGILRHVVLDTFRARSRMPREEALPPFDESSEPGPLDVILADEEASALRAAFEELGPADREVLELRVVAGLSSDEVAAVLGKRPGAVRMAQARALERLRTSLVRQQT